VDHIFDHDRSRYRLLLSDRGRFAAERKERRPGCSFRRPGQPDRVWSAGRGFGSFPGDDLVRDHFHGHVDHAFDFCGAENRVHVRTFGSETGADEVAACDAASRSAASGADTEISCERRTGRDARRSIIGLATRSPHQKWILFPFFADGCSRAVAWNHDGIIG
jgi:hypothetical protein